MNDELDFLEDDWDPIGASEDAPDGSFGPVPDGWYDATIVRSEMCDTKAGTGRYLKLAFKIDGPSYAGRWVWTNLNLVNPSEQAQAIGRAQFGKLLVGLGFKRRPKDTALLLDKQCRIKVATRKWNGEEQNEVKSFGASSSQPPASTPPAQPKKKADPWAR